MRGLGSQLPEDFRKCGFGNTEGIQSDQLIALDAFRVSKATLPEVFRQLGTQTPHKLTFFRTDRMMTVDIGPLDTASPKSRFERKTPMEHGWPSAGLSQPR